MLTRKPEQREPTAPPPTVAIRQLRHSPTANAADMTSFAPPPTTTKTASIATAFTRKLYRMLDVEDPVVIGWDADGLSFSIRDEEQLDTHVLPRYFRGRVDVFRQHLNEHGFRSVSSIVDSKQQESFSHTYFVRGAPNQLSLIVRVPSSKRRRSRLGKKRASPGVARPREIKCEDPCTMMPSFVESDAFNLFDYLHDSTSVTTAIPSLSSEPEVAPPCGKDEDLHSSLVNILAMHAMNPVVSSRAMLDGEPGSPVSSGQIDTPVFSFELMASMVEWLDTTA